MGFLTRFLLRVPMMEALKALSTDHASQSIMERIRGRIQSLGKGGREKRRSMK